MSPRTLFYLAFAVCIALFAGAAPDKTLSKLAKPPEGLSPKVASALSPEGFRVAGGEGPVCDVWVLNDLALKADFKPSANVKYPFQPGQLIGVLRVADKIEFTDFRGQAIKPGVYTLRYGQQPQDGNHLGTSEVADFLVAIPAADDADPKPVGPVDKLHKASAKTAGGNHPAIFSLLPTEGTAKDAALGKDDKDHWFIDLPVRGEQGGKKTALSVRMVVIGKAEG
jgi:hypothetical protein